MNSTNLAVYKAFFPLQTYSSLCGLFEKLFSVGKDAPLVFATFVLAAVSEQVDAVAQQSDVKPEEISSSNSDFPAVEWDAVQLQIENARSTLREQFRSVHKSAIENATLSIAEYCSALLIRTRSRGAPSRTVEDKVSSGSELEPVRAYFANSDQIGDVGRVACLTVVACALLGVQRPTLALSECHIWLRIHELKGKWTDVELSCHRGRATQTVYRIGQQQREANWRYAADAPVLLEACWQQLGGFVTLGRLGAHARRLLLRVASLQGALNDYPLALCAYAELEYAVLTKRLPSYGSASLDYGQICELFAQAVRVNRMRYRDRHLEPQLKYATLLLSSTLLCPGAAADAQGSCTCVCHSQGALALLCAASASLMRTYAFSSDNAPVFDELVAQFAKRGVNASRSVLDLLNAESGPAVRSRQAQQPQVAEDVETQARRRGGRRSAATSKEQETEDGNASNARLVFTDDPLVFGYFLVFFDQLATFEEQRFVNLHSSQTGPRSLPRFASWTEAFLRLLPRFTSQAMRRCVILERQQFDDRKTLTFELDCPKDDSKRVAMESKSQSNGCEGEESAMLTEEQVRDIVQQCADGKLVNLTHFFDSRRFPIAFSALPQSESDCQSTQLAATALQQQLAALHTLHNERRNFLDCAKRTALKRKSQVSCLQPRCSPQWGSAASSSCSCLHSDRLQPSDVKLVRVALRSVRLRKLMGLLEQFAKADDAAIRVQVVATIKLHLHA